MPCARNLRPGSLSWRRRLGTTVLTLSRHYPRLGPSSIRWNGRHVVNSDQGDCFPRSPHVLRHACWAVVAVT